MLSKEFLQFKNGPSFVPRHDFKHDTEAAIAQYRRDLEMNTLPGGVLPDGCTTEAVTVGGIPCAMIRFDGAVPDWLMIQIHGGGFASGGPCVKQGPMIRIGQECGINILSVDYRLAPEHPYPAALEDCVAVYRAVLESGQDPQKIIFCGESAGATLSLVTNLYARDHGLPVPAAIVISSPCADSGLSVEERRAFAPTDPLLDESDELMAFYVADTDPKTPYLSPAYADFTGMPPIFLQCGTDEMLGSDSALIYRNCLEANVDILVHAYAWMGHVFFLQAGLYPEADAGLQEMITYIRGVMGR